MGIEVKTITTPTKATATTTLGMATSQKMRSRQKGWV